MKNTIPDHYLVIGNPISQSLSPQIHAHFAKQTQQLLTYDRLCVEPKDFFSALDNFFAQGGKGANITAPFKEMAFEYTQSRCSDAAQLAKAVNTLYLNPVDHCVWGDNTDGIGLLRDFKHLKWTVTGKKILIFGAGGAVRGILPALLSENPESITLCNRTESKAVQLIHEFQALGHSLGNSLSNLQYMPMDLTSDGQDVHSDLQNTNSDAKNIALPECYDMIINAIPSTQVAAAACWHWLPKAISPSTYIYDLSYSSERDVDTVFIDFFKNAVTTTGTQSSLIHDGFGMLLEQAAESFYIWRGVKPQDKYTLP